MKYLKTVTHLEIDRFMGPWHVIAGRTTFFERGAFSPVEIYTWNEKEGRIDIDYNFKKNSFHGPKKSIPQKAWIDNLHTNAHWKVQPIWPLKFDYLVLALDTDYHWTVVGVPNQAYLWIMARTTQLPEETLKQIIKNIGLMGYNVEGIKMQPQLNGSVP